MAYGTPSQDESATKYTGSFDTGVMAGDYPVYIKVSVSTDNPGFASVEDAFQDFIDAVEANTSYTFVGGERSKLFTESITTS